MVDHVSVGELRQMEKDEGDDGGGPECRRRRGEWGDAR